MSILGAIGLSLLLAWRGETAILLELWAGAGLAAAALGAAGMLGFPGPGDTSDRSIADILEACSTPAAVTARNGKILWRSHSFAKAAGLPVDSRNMARLADGDASLSSSLFRFFAAMRVGQGHRELMQCSSGGEGRSFQLKVTPGSGGKRREPIFMWQVEAETGWASSAEAGSGDAAVSYESMPLPALIVSKDLTIKTANNAFRSFTGASTTLGGVALADILRQSSGARFPAPQLRSILSLSSQALPVQFAAGGGKTLRAVAVGNPVGQGDRLVILIPAGDTGFPPEAAFESLLVHSPIAAALLTAKGDIYLSNEAFRSLIGNGSNSDPVALPALIADRTLLPALQTFLALPEKGNKAGAQEIEITTALVSYPDKRVRLFLRRLPNSNQIMLQAIEAPGEVTFDEKAVQSQKMQAVGELAGGIAHDFNNLLTAIIGFSDLLLSRFRASDPAFKDVMNIKNNATRAAELVRHILAYSRRQTLRPSILTVTDVIEDFHASVGRVLGEKVKAKIEHGRDLWFVKADEGQLFQVVMNLAVNARDAMPDGGEILIRTANVSERSSLELASRGLERGEYVLCEVRDSGTGIKPEHLAKIFDPFFSTKEVGKGTGLGLSTVYGIVKQTGGTILVDSEIGRGTSFQIYLPRYVETEQDLKALETKSEAPSKSADLTGGGTVLLVEDEEAVRSFASRALSTRGYTVLEAGSGVEALEVMDRQNGHIDLVVSDVVMPEMDGPTLLRHLRQRQPNIKIVFMSGYAEEAFRKNLSAEEDFIFLPKPFTLKKLAETVKAATPGK